MNRMSMAGRDSLAQGWMAIVGVVLVATGLIGFIQNPLAYSTDAILIVDNVHNIVHLGTGALALFIAFGLRGEQQINATLGFGCPLRRHLRPEPDQPEPVRPVQRSGEHADPRRARARSRS